MVVQFVNSDQTYFDAFYIHDLGFIITKMDDPLVVQRLHGICKALFAVIMAVVIGCVHRLNISCAQNRREFRGSFECELFFLPFLRVGEGSLEIGNGEIVCGENAFYVGKEIVRTVAFVISVQAGVVVEISSVPRVQSPTTLTVRETGSAGREEVSPDCPPPVSSCASEPSSLDSPFSDTALSRPFSVPVCVFCPSEAAELLFARLHAREPKIITRSRRTAPATQSAAIIFFRRSR